VFSFSRGYDPDEDGGGPRERQRRSEVFEKAVEKKASGVALN
jgi:hypothetical protein